MHLVQLAYMGRYRVVFSKSKYLEATSCTYIPSTRRFILRYDMKVAFTDCITREVLLLKKNKKLDQIFRAGGFLGIPQLLDFFLWCFFNEKRKNPDASGLN